MIFLYIKQGVTSLEVEFPEQHTLLTSKVNTPKYAGTARLTISCVWIKVDMTKGFKGTKIEGIPTAIGVYVIYKLSIRFAESKFVRGEFHVQV